MKRFVQLQPIITFPQLFSPKSFPQNDVLASRPVGGFRSCSRNFRKVVIPKITTTVSNI